jgi:hypothetical protein
VTHNLDRDGGHALSDPEFEEILTVLLDLQMSADSLSALTRQALVRLSALSGEPDRRSWHHALLNDDEGSIP